MLNYIVIDAHFLTQGGKIPEDLKYSVKCTKKNTRIK